MVLDILDILSLVFIITIIIYTIKIRLLIPAKQISLLIIGYFLIGIIQLGFIAINYIPISPEFLLLNRTVAEVSVALRSFPILLVMLGWIYLYDALKAVLKNGSKIKYGRRSTD